MVQRASAKDIFDLALCPDLEELETGAASSAPVRQSTRERAIVELYDRLRPSLLVHLVAMGVSWHAAEDIVHDSFLRLFDHLERKGGGKNLQGWIFRVAHNRAMDYFRRDRLWIKQETPDRDPLERIADPSGSPEDHALYKEEIQRVRRALAGLTRQQRAAVLLRAEELGYRDIGVILGVSHKRVSELIHRALDRLAGGM